MNNKVTIEDVLSSIKKTTYTVLPDGRTTVCQGTLYNGFTIIGTSACVDIANFNRAAGEKYAFDDMVKKVWTILGAILAERIWKASNEKL